jgi:hypothetical protein
MSNKPYLFVNSPCPICPDNPVRGVGVELDDIENENELRVFSVICGHFWNLPDGTAAKIKRAM